MLCRWLLTFAGLTVIHAVVSCVAFLMAYAAWESGPAWLENLILWTFFFPFWCLRMAGVVDGLIDDSLANLVINSVCWVAVVYPVWIVGHRLSRKFFLQRRVAVTDRPR
jgi:hypothetical protein